MRKVLAYIDDSGLLYDSDKTGTGFNVSNFKFDDADIRPDVAKLMSLGATTDDILKLKASDVI